MVEESLRPILFLFACGTLACNSVPEERVPPWPEWVYHHWVWEDESTQESALALANGYAAQNIPVGAVIIDSPWATGYNTFDWDPLLFPEPQEMIDELHEQDVRVVMWIVPAINVEEVALYTEATENGYFMQADADSGPVVVDWWKGQGSLIDYFNPEALAWWHGLMDTTIEYGIDGWKCDGLDFSSFLAPYSPGLGRKVTRLEYSHAYYRDSFDYLRERLGDDRLITSRPVDNYGADVGGEGVSFTPVDITWAGWVGDQDPDFAGLRAALNNMYYSAQMGYVNIGSDIGGYRQDGSALGREKESFVRWAQLGAFSPFMENGGSGEHRPWLFDAETLEVYQRFTALHYALIPYLMREGAQSYAESRPLMDFLHDTTYIYRLGPDVFVAPFLESGTEISVQFPDSGRWIYLFDTRQVHEPGSTAQLTVPLQEFPVFVREGAPLGEVLAAILEAN